ncbi:uncharacterized protein [Clytia hemisphaerica]|uniref:TRAF-type domain-containing protein n=1 Tax=Clytia hemisphaerica TaxID=252671 RepID=A0A7M5X2F5_9CNID
MGLEELDLATTMVVPSKGPAYILLKDTVGLKRAKRRIGVRFGSQTIFTAHAGAIYLANKDDKQPQDKTMISLVSLTDTKRILVTAKENTRMLTTAELNMMLPITSDQRRAKILSTSVFMEAITAQIDDVVAVNDGEHQAIATIKYVGQLPWKQHTGVYLGVEFEKPIGENDGCDLFETKEEHGKFITVDKIDKFIIKNEKAHYTTTEDALNQKPTDEKKIYKRLSFPIVSTLIKMKPKIKSASSLNDLTKREDHQRGTNGNDEIDAHRKRSSTECSPNTAPIKHDDDDVPIYAVSEICVNQEPPHESNESDEKEKKANKRMSFPVSLSNLVPSFPAMPKMRLRSKSLENVHKLNVENPYYAAALNIRKQSLEGIDEGDEVIVLCFNQGCDVKLEKDLLQKHQQQCPYALEKCPNNGCDLEMRRIDINKHDIMECEHAIVNCKQPGCQVILSRKLMTKHSKECAKEVPKDSTPQDAYEKMSAGTDEVIYASSGPSFSCPAPRCLYHSEGKQIMAHICSQHSELLLKHLNEIKLIFAKEEKDFSHLYTKPIKKVAPIPRPRKPSNNDEAPLYSTPCREVSNSEAEKNYGGNPLYTTPDEKLTSRKVEDTEYLTPVDGCKMTNNHVYLTPVDDGKNNKNSNDKKSSSQGEYEYVAWDLKSMSIPA